MLNPRVFHIFNVNRSQVFADQFRRSNNSGYCSHASSSAFELKYFLFVMVNILCDYLWNILCLNSRWNIRLSSLETNSFYIFWHCDDDNVGISELIMLACIENIASTQLMLLCNCCAYVFIFGFIEQ